MATEIEAQATGPGLAPYRLTVRQFETMIEAGIFPDRARVELLGGLLVDKMTKNDPHGFAVGLIAEGLRGSLPPGWFVREEKSAVLGRRDRPEPDIAVVRGRWKDFRRAPRPKDLAQIVEVADSTYTKDRKAKWWRYAAARVPFYWIANLPKRQAEVYSDPAGRGAAASYHQCTVYAEDAEVPIVIDVRDVGRIAVRDILV